LVDGPLTSFYHAGPRLTSILRGRTEPATCCPPQKPRRSCHCVCLILLALCSICCGKPKLTMSPLRKQGSISKNLDSCFRRNDKCCFHNRNYITIFLTRSYLPMSLRRSRRRLRQSQSTPKREIATAPRGSRNDDSGCAALRDRVLTSAAINSQKIRPHPFREESQKKVDFRRRIRYRGRRRVKECKDAAC